jgi:hypothetical protein
LFGSASLHIFTIIESLTAEETTAMTKRTILATSMLALATISSPAFAYSNVSPRASIGSASGLGNAAGSIAAGANSALNPSGNSFIVPPPGAIGAGVFVRPQR